MGGLGYRSGEGAWKDLEGPWNVHLAFPAGADLGGDNSRALSCMGMYFVPGRLLQTGPDA